jgi:hypothetical protein
MWSSKHRLCRGLYLWLRSGHQPRRKYSIFPSPYARALRAFKATIASAWAGVSWPSTIQVPGPGM